MYGSAVERGYLCCQEQIRHGKAACLDLQSAQGHLFLARVVVLREMLELAQVLQVLRAAHLLETKCSPS